MAAVGSVCTQTKKSELWFTGATLQLGTQQIKGICKEWCFKVDGKVSAQSHKSQWNGFDTCHGSVFVFLSLPVEMNINPLK